MPLRRRMQRSRRTLAQHAAAERPALSAPVLLRYLPTARRAGSGTAAQVHRVARDAAAPAELRELCRQLAACLGAA
jgi:hypothetical protein